MTSFEEAHGHTVEELEEATGWRLFSKLGAVGLRPAGPAPTDLAMVAAEFHCPVDGCEQLHEGFRLVGVVSPS